MTYWLDKQMRKLFVDNCQHCPCWRYSNNKWTKVATTMVDIVKETAALQFCGNKHANRIPGQHFKPGLQLLPTALGSKNFISKVALFGYLSADVRYIFKLPNQYGQSLCWAITLEQLFVDLWELVLYLFQQLIWFTWENLSIA